MVRGLIGLGLAAVMFAGCGGPDASSTAVPSSSVNAGALSEAALLELGGRLPPLPSLHPSVPVFPVPATATRTRNGTYGTEPAPVLFLGWSTASTPDEVVAFYTGLADPRWLVVSSTTELTGTVRVEIADTSRAFQKASLAIRPVTRGSSLSLVLVPVARQPSPVGDPLDPLVAQGSTAPASLPAPLALEGGAVLVATESDRETIAVFRFAEASFASIADRYVVVLENMSASYSRRDGDGGVLLDAGPMGKIIVRAYEGGTEASVEWLR